MTQPYIHMKRNIHLRRTTGIIAIICIAMLKFSAANAETTALLISDNRMTSDSWTWIFSDEMGLNVSHSTSCYDCRLKSETGMSDDVARVLSNNNIRSQKPGVILLQLGCNDTADADGSMSAYEHSLFDYPYGKVCNNKGANPRTKNIAVSKNDGRVTNANFAGSIYRIVKFLREQTPDSRIFLLAPCRYGSEKTSDEIAKNAQIRLVAQMLCVPFVEDANMLQKYSFVWNGMKPSLGNVLLIGDSYCATKKWTGQLEKIANVSLTNVGKTSATLKERKGHTNTLGAQLLRIPATCRPDIILLEGGINDDADTERTVEAYPEHIQNLKRTNFAGALAYLVKVLRGRFPNAQIYAVTPGGLYYGHTDHPFDFIVKSEQIRRAASLIGIPTIDWDCEGRLSFVFNNSKGTGAGTEASPFIYNVPTLETGDMLHPNERGGRYLAECAVARLCSK